jgi:hypothetical protein
MIALLHDAAAIEHEDANRARAPSIADARSRSRFARQRALDRLLDRRR